MSTTTTGQLELVHVPPGSLLVDRNIRLGLDIGDEFVESLRTHGVLQPIVAVRVVRPDGNGEGNDYALRVRFGNRRTIGSITAGLAEVPVLVAGDEATDDPAEIERILTQLAENDDRQALTTLDHINAFEQLAMLGLDQVAIAQRTRRDVDDVTAALKAGKSQVATDTALAVPDLTLERLAVIAEFDDEPETVKKLATEGAGLSDGGWAHLVSNARRDRASRIRAELAYTRLVELLKAEGLEENRIIAPPSYDGPAKRLGSLSPGDGELRDLTVEDHKTCSGHVAYLHLRNERWNFTKAEPAVPGGAVLLAPDPRAPEADDPYVEEVEVCSVCGCTEDEPCEVLYPGDEENEEVGGCAWSKVTDPQNPGGLVCTACITEEGELIEERRGANAAVRPIEDVALPGDEAPPKPDVIDYATWYEAGWACLDPKEFGHRDRYGSSGGSWRLNPKMDELPPAEKEEKRKERKDVIDSNKAWKAATPVRRAWLKTFLTATKTPPPGAGAFMAEILTVNGPYLDKVQGGGAKLLAESIGVKHTDSLYGAGETKRALATAAQKATDARALVVALGYVMACCEDQTDTNTWRRKLDFEKAYFRFLADCGYELSKVEQRVIGNYKPKNAPKARSAKAPAKPRAPRRSTAAKAADSAPVAP
jgi:hypothetical protein